MASAHIPAWRKLGLKLKSEQNGGSKSPTVLPTIESSPAAKRRKLSLPNGIGDQIRAQEARRRNGMQDEGNGMPFTEGDGSKGEDAAKIDVTCVNGAPSGRRSSLARSSSLEDQSSPRKRKSVSFTPDTKLQDGGKSAKDFYSARVYITPPVIENYIFPDLDPFAFEPPSGENGEPGESAKPVEQTNSQSTLTSSPLPRHFSTNVSTSVHEDLRLQYLTEYYTSRRSWKFSTNKQNWILTNALDLDKIPPSYDQALSVYVDGLIGKMPRARLFRSAKEVIEADDAALARETEAAKATASSSTITVSSSKKRSRSPSPHDTENDIYPDSARIADYVAAIKRIRAQVRDRELLMEEEEFRGSREYLRRLMMRRRAEKLVWKCRPEVHMAREIDPKDSRIRVPTKKTVITSEPITAPKSLTSASTQKGRRRKRRRRTDDEVDDTSSDETDLESDDENEWATALATAVVNGKELPDGKQKKEKEKNVVVKQEASVNGKTANPAASKPKAVRRAMSLNKSMSSSPQPVLYVGAKPRGVSSGSESEESSEAESSEAESGSGSEEVSGSDSGSGSGSDEESSSAPPSEESGLERDS